MARKGLAACAVFRDEAPYILEWIAYRHAAGVARFVLYHNASTDGGANRIAACPLASLVTIVSWPEPSTFAFGVPAFPGQFREPVRVGSVHRHRRIPAAAERRGGASVAGAASATAQIEAQCTVTDTAIQRFLPAVGKCLSGAVPPPPAPADGWEAHGEDCFISPDAMVVRDRSRQGSPWLAALHGPGRPTDPWFLTDGLERIRSFASAAASKAACAGARRR